jgi:hypothetical protein
MSLLKNLSEEQWRVFVVELFPPEILKVLAEDAVTQTVAYLNGEQDRVILSLTSIKAYLGSQGGTDAIFGMLEDQPDCTLEQLTAMATGQTEMILCHPPETILFIDVRPVYESQIKAAVSLIPEQVSLFQANENRIQNIRDLRTLRLFMRVSPLLPLMFLVLMTVSAVRSLKDWLNWWGYPFLFAGLLSMFIGVLSGPMASLTFQIFIATALPDVIPQSIVNLFKELTAAIIRNALQPTLFIAGGMAFVGLFMIALTFLFRGQPQSGLRHVR